MATEIEPTEIKAHCPSCDQNTLNKYPGGVVECECGYEDGRPMPELPAPQPVALEGPSHLVTLADVLDQIIPPPAAPDDPAGWDLLDVANFAAWTFPPVEWLIEDLLPKRGLVWMGGAPKGSKSLLWLYLMLAIAARRVDVLDRFKIREYPNILYICREDPGWRVKARTEDIVAAWEDQIGEDSFHIVVRPHLDLRNPLHITWLRLVCKKKNIGLVVLDTWTALSPGADPMGAKDQNDIAQAVANFSQDFDGATVILDHTRKNKIEGSLLTSADIYGPDVKRRVADHIIMLAYRGDATDEAEVHISGKDVESTRFYVRISPRGSGEEKVTYSGTVEPMINSRRKTGVKNKDAVLTAIEAAGSVGISREALEQATGLAKTTIVRHLEKLREGKLIEQQGQGPATVYTPADLGL